MIDSQAAYNAHWNDS